MPKYTTNRWGKAALTAAASTLAIMAATPAAIAQEPAAATAEQQVNIPAGPLDDALITISEIFGVTVIAPNELVSGKSTTGVSGAVTTEQAIERLLAGSGLEFERSSTGAYLVTEVVAQVEPVAQPAREAVVEGEPEPRVEDTIIVTGQLTNKQASVGVLGRLDVLDTPYSVTSYSQDLLSSQQAVNLYDVLENDPGISTSFNQFQGVDGFIVRGFEIFSSSVQINGLFGVSPTQTGSFVFADTVDVLRGPSSLLTGTGPGGQIGGVLSITTKRAENEPITDLKLNYISDGYVSGRADIGRRFGTADELGVRFNALYGEGSTPLEGQRDENAIFALGTDYTIGDVRLTLDASYAERDLGPQARAPLIASGVIVPDAPRNSLPQQGDFARFKTEDYFVIGSAEWDVASWLTAYATGGYGDSEVDLVASFSRITDEDGTATETNFESPAFDESWSGRFGVRGDFVTGSLSHNYVLEYSIIDLESANAFTIGQSFQQNIFESRTSVGPDITVRDIDQSTRSLQTLESFVIGDTISLFDDRVSVVGGARYQNIKQGSFNPVTGSRETEYDEARWSPSVGVTFKPTENSSIYANYIEALSEGPIAPDTAVNAGEVFQPSVSDQIEIGAKLDFNGLFIQAAAFQIETDEADLNPDTNVFEFLGTTRVQGLEFFASGSVTERLKVLGGFSLIDAEFTEAIDPALQGNTAPGTFDQRVSLYAEYNLPSLSDAITVGGRFIYQGDQFVDVENLQELPDWVRFDLNAAIDFSKFSNTPLILRASVENIADEDYWSGTNGRSQLAFGLPRTFLLEAAYSF
ncbi:MAG: TonB-dependent receptor [Pseudomonadota bacterium]